MKTIEHFQTLWPNVNIFTSFDLTGIQDAHLVISADKLDFPGFIREKLFQEDIVLAVAKGTLPDGPITSLSLQNKHFITMDEGSSLYRFTESICEDIGFRPHIALKSADPFYIRRCVELGLGVAFVPTFSWHDQFSDDVELKHIGPYKRDVFLYRRARHFNAVFIERFCNTLKEDIQKELYGV
jgi:DNA-binding transcriptional LysR family regulator